MDVKEYLNQYLKIKKMLKCNIDELNQVVSLGQIANNKNYLKQIYEDVSDCCEQLKEIHKLVYRSIPLEKGETILVMDARYIKGMSWGEISMAYDINTRTIARREKEGLEYVQQYLESG